jgi:hypothetical protein
MTAYEFALYVSVGAWIQGQGIGHTVDKTTGHQRFLVSRMECPDWNNV